jgi:RimJ/RimL family protein N-acetyltransferase
MTFRKALKSELDLLDLISLETINHMLSIGLKQWVPSYPRKADFEQDIENGALYVLTEGPMIVGIVALLKDNDPKYATIDTWKRDSSLVCHRVLIHSKHQGKGYAKILFSSIIEFAKRNNFPSIKIDTHIDNIRMKSLLNSIGFEERGYIEVMDRYAYELVL